MLKAIIRYLFRGEFDNLATRLRGLTTDSECTITIKAVDEASPVLDRIREKVEALGICPSCGHELLREEDASP